MAVLMQAVLLVQCVQGAPWQAHCMRVVVRRPCHRFRGMGLHLGPAGLVHSRRHTPIPGLAGGPTRQQVIGEVCREVFAFMLVVQPHKVIFHQNAVAHGWQSVDALIAAGEQVQEQAGPPVPGTYRHDFMNDWTPRHMPVSRRRGTRDYATWFGVAETDDEAALRWCEAWAMACTT